jgi:hypothetical protein
MKQKQKDFLTLRADGLSFDKIAKKLNTHKTTLIEWSKIYSKELSDLQFINLQQLKEQYKHTTTERYKQLLKHLNKIDEALEGIDLQTANIKDLMMVRNDLLDKLSKIEARAEHTTSLKEPSILNQPLTLEDDTPIKVKLDEL